MKRPEKNGFILQNQEEEILEEAEVNENNNTLAEDDQDLHLCKRRTRWAIRAGIILLCTVICLYQIVLVCQLYFTYPTNVDIRLDDSGVVHLPAVTICSELAATILTDKIVQFAPPRLASLLAGKSRPEVNRLLGSARVRQQLLAVLQSLPIDHQHRLTVSSGQFLRNCHLPTVVGSGKSTKDSQTTSQVSVINCNQFGPIIESINYRYKCFSLFLNRFNGSSQASAQKYDLPVDVIANFKYLVWITLNRDYIFNGFVFIHPPDVSHQFSNQKNVQHLDPGRHESVTVAFTREVIRLLPPPYETQCHDYRRSGYQCRAQCMAACKVRHYLQLDGWPGDVYAEADVRAPLSRVWLNDQSETGHLEEGVDAAADGQPTTDNCSAHCGRRDDCERAQYDVRTVRITERDRDDPLEPTAAAASAGLMTVRILPPTEVQMVIRHVPKYAVVEFLIYVGSLANLYLGFSAISVGVALLTYFSFSSKVQTRHVCIPVRRKRLLPHTKQQLSRLKLVNGGKANNEEIGMLSSVSSGSSSDGSSGNSCNQTWANNRHLNHHHNNNGHKSLENKTKL